VATDAECAALGQALGQEPAQRNTRRLSASLERIAELHAELADAYRALAADTGAIGLAERADPSVTAAMTTGFCDAEADATAPPDDPDYLTQAALAAMLDTHPRTIRRMELEGELPAATEIGRLKRWRRSTVQTWLDEGCPKPRRARR
jgi:predicted DNA-binding transcriptional regulator AlpA